MIGFFSLSNDNSTILKKDEIFFVHFPNDATKEGIKQYCASYAQSFANKLDSNKVYLNYGKDEFIEYEYSI